MSESEDLRQFIHEIALRIERATQALAADNALRREELRIIREENRVYFETLRKDTKEIAAEGKAQREALFRILDRFDGRGGPAAAS